MDQITNNNEELASRAEHFTAQGELRLLHNDPTGIDLFEVASQLDQKNSELLYRQGLALFEYGSEEEDDKALRLAAKKFKASTQIDPAFFHAWQAWGDLLNCQAIVTGQKQFFELAQEKFAKALDLADPKDAEKIAELHWHYGFSLFETAKHSKEALDYQKAIEALQKASTSAEQFTEEFWVCFGNVCKEFSLCIGDIRLLIKALHCFKHAVTLAVNCFEAWEAMAITLQILYEKTHDEDHFSQANECYSAGSQLNPSSVDIWLNWAIFLYESGKRSHDLKRIRSAVEKCQRASCIEPNHPKVLGTWAECLASIGEITERLDLLHEALNKASQASEIAPCDLHVCLAHGNCLQALGHYFQECDYYYQAIERWQIGLSMDRTCHSLWHAIACTYLMIGTLDPDGNDLEKACHFFTKAIDLHTCSVYFFDYALALSKLGETVHKLETLELAITYFEKALHIQKNALYLHPDWLFYYAYTIDLLGSYYEDPSIYSRAIEIFSHVLTIDPDFPMIHYKLGMTCLHMGELLEEPECFQKALHCMRLASKRDEDNDQILLDWAVVLINASQCGTSEQEAHSFLKEAELKLIEACKLGNTQAHYQMACLHSLLGQYEKAIGCIEKASIFHALPPLEELIQDDWLEGLRSTAYFQEIVDRMAKVRITEADEDSNTKL